MKPFQERESLFWNLFVLDKNISFLTGKPCLLPSYDCDVQAPSPGTDNLSQQYFSSRVDLTIIQEQIVRQLSFSEHNPPLRQLFSLDILCTKHNFQNKDTDSSFFVRQYLRLYSADALRQENFQREESVNTLSRKLELWLQGHQELLSKTEFFVEGRFLQHLGLEQSILCDLYHVMVLRRSNQNANSAKCLGVSRNVMENLKNLAERRDLLGKEASLRR